MPRYEIYLPIKFNDGNPIPDELFVEVKNEIIDNFGALTTMPPNTPVVGYWKSEGVLYKDDIVIYTVTTAQDEDEFFKQYKNKLANRFKQLEIWIEKVPVEVL